MDGAKCCNFPAKLRRSLEIENDFACNSQVVQNTISAS